MPDPPLPPVVDAVPTLVLVIVGPLDAPLSPEFPVLPNVVLDAPPKLLVPPAPISVPPTVVESDAPFAADPVVVPTPVPIRPVVEPVLPTVLGATVVVLSGASAGFPQPVPLSTPTSKRCEVCRRPTPSVYP